MSRAVSWGANDAGVDAEQSLMRPTTGIPVSGRADLVVLSWVEVDSRNVELVGQSRSGLSRRSDRVLAQIARHA